jgi:hypothetical protein
VADTETTQLRNELLLESIASKEPETN